MIWTPFYFRPRLISLPIWLLLAATMAQAEPPKLILPTENDGLLTGDFAGFYGTIELDVDFLNHLLGTNTGPPAAHSFAELILQRSLLSHAPPMLG